MRLISGVGSIGRRLPGRVAKTRIVDSRTVSFAFRSYEFPGQHHWSRKKSLPKLNDSVREKTRRTSGESLKCVIAKLNQSLQGWFACFLARTRLGL